MCIQTPRMGMVSLGSEGSLWFTLDIYRASPWGLSTPRKPKTSVLRELTDTSTIQALVPDCPGMG